MSKLMRNRTDNDIKNKWNSMVRSQRSNEAKYGQKQNLPLTFRRSEHQQSNKALGRNPVPANQQEYDISDFVQSGSRNVNEAKASTIARPYTVLGSSKASNRLENFGSREIGVIDSV